MIEDKIDELIVKGNFKPALELLREEFIKLDKVVSDDILLVISKLTELERK